MCDGGICVYVCGDWWLRMCVQVVWEKRKMALVWTLMLLVCLGYYTFKMVNVRNSATKSFFSPPPKKYIHHGTRNNEFFLILRKKFLCNVNFMLRWADVIRPTLISLKS